MKASACITVFSIALSASAHAELKQSATDSALIEHRFEIAVPVAEAWRALLHPEQWWPPDHTWSGKAENLRLVPIAGGCFCERWDSGSAEHARVVMISNERLLRLRGSLGPLQEMAVAGVLSVALTPDENGATRAVVTYRIGGDASQHLDEFVPVVDKVIGQQFGAWARQFADN
jgi:uncharacterized protein YndB with AHSA1/START domain